MSSRRFERLPTIRGKLSATIVVAVAIAIAISYVLIGFALRDTPKASEAIEALKLARRIANGDQSPLPSDTMIVRRSITGEISVDGVNFGDLPTDIRESGDRVPQWGLWDNYVWASIPTEQGATLIVVYPSPTRGFLGRISATLGFLQSYSWQFLMAGAIAAAIALGLARWFARGMTQPLRDMAEAARRMETGDYSTRVDTDSRDEVGQLAVAFNRMSSELELLETSRRELVANVSHELKTPLAAIRGYAETLVDGAIDEPATARRFTERILEQCRRLGELLDDLLTLSRLESTEPFRTTEPVELAALAQEAIELVTERAAARRNSVALTATGPLTVVGDAEGLLRLLSNLLDNAVKYNREGGAVAMRLTRQGDQAVIEVEDQGIGIPAVHQARIFERFYRVDSGRTRETGGTGLGLAIVKHVAQAHGGRVEVDSDPGRGSTFRVLLPLAA